MLFNFQSFIQSLREKEDKKEVVEKYEKFYGIIEGEVEDQKWYKEYIINFISLEFISPNELKNQFDWELLCKLVLGSFSSEVRFLTKEDSLLPELEIEVKNGNTSIVKLVSELWSFQIMRLYDIYIEEQMNLQILMTEGTEEDIMAIKGQRDYRLAKHNLSHKRIKLLSELGLFQETD